VSSSVSMDHGDRRINHSAATRYARPVPPSRSNRPPLPGRAHLQARPPAPPASVARNAELITLDQVRPVPRCLNEYVDTPHTGEPPSSRVLLPAPPIFTQPSPSGLKPDPAKDSHEEEHSESIYCSRCRKCQCQACTEPRELPSRWICNNKCHCSALKIVDYCSCLCCVQCVFYHCCKDSATDDDFSATDDPCACCEKPDCFKRWTCMGLASLVLPCLCFYWPLRCSVALCTKCYNRCTRKGCRCKKEKLPPGQKRLLIDSESSST